jgi:integral membrane sensor domain MASE1
MEFLSGHTILSIVAILTTIPAFSYAQKQYDAGKTLLALSTYLLISIALTLTIIRNF